MRHSRPVSSSFDRSAFVGFRVPPDVILLAVRWYLRYGLSYRDVEELLAERGIEADHVTIFQWVQRFTPLLIDAARPCRHAVGGHWFVDETYVKVAGKWRYVYRAVDQHGQVIDVFVSDRRNIEAARKFFGAALTAHGQPEEVITDLATAPMGNTRAAGTSRRPTTVTRTAGCKTATVVASGSSCRCGDREGGF
jgi:IS6 family transposase